MLARNKLIIKWALYAAAALLCLPSVCPPTASMEGGGESEFRVLLDLTQIHTQQTI